MQKHLRKIEECGIRVHERLEGQGLDRYREGCRAIAWVAKIQKLP